MEGRTAVLDAPLSRRARVRPPRGPWPRRRWLWLAAALAVVAGIGIVVAVLLSGRAETVVGAAGSGAAADAVAGPEQAALASTIEEAAALAGSTTANLLADPTAYSRLMGELAEARVAQSGTPAAASAARDELTAAMDRVVRSQNAKALADAQTGLGAVIDTAEAVAAETEGRIDDAGLLAELGSRIEAGRAVLATRTATVEAVGESRQSIADQTAAVLAARMSGFRAADGEWCAVDGRSCMAVAWPQARLADGSSVGLAGAENAVGGCFETDRIGSGRSAFALLYCPAGTPLPDGRKASGATAGDAAQDRLWISRDGKLADLRVRD